jgi:hypothetical protein
LVCRVTVWKNDWPTLSGPVDGAKLRVLSLGAGVQSTTLALAASRGDVGPMPDCAIFADTQWEPKRVRRHLDWLKTQLRFPVYEVTAGSIRDAIRDRRNTTGQRFAAIPWFILRPDGSVGMGRRQCTKEYKLQPINKEVRRLLGVGPKGYIAPNSVEMWIGISTDEVIRMKPSRVKFMRNRFPLIEAGMNRAHCNRWLAERQAGAAESSCTGCPFHTNAMWRNLRDNEPDEWADAVEADRELRMNVDTRKMKGLEFMHRSCVPLDQAPIDEPEDRAIHLPGFDMECEGMCGV